MTSKPKPPSDFNDLHQLSGLATVEHQLREALKTAAAEPPASSAYPAQNMAAGAESSAPAQPEAGAVGVDNPSHAHPEKRADAAPENEGSEKFGVFSLDGMLSNFSLIYGTDTVWDAREHLQMRLSHLRHIVGRGLYKVWDEHDDRDVKRGLVFEPSGVIPANHINLFRGFPLTPGKVGREGCLKILDHIYNLCRMRDAEFQYLLRWIAYPLQNPGAKMDSSVIMYGAEGPGKSVLWEQVVSQLYGQSSITIGQSQLEDKFTGWQSGRLFALCEEVVSRAERSQHKGQLKHLVTGKYLMINEKNLPLREERNHINFVFLSNSTVPLELDMGDRRYLVLYCDYVPGGSYFTELFEEINNGGVEELYRFLLDLDMTGFNEHTRPPMNQDKQNLIDASLPSPVLFLNEWRQGLLDIPYCSCVKSDLFHEFIRWCERTNEFKRRDRDFVAEIRRHLMEGRHDLVLTGMTRKTARVWITEEDAKHQLADDFVKRIEDSCLRFRDAVAARRSPNGD